MRFIPLIAIIAAVAAATAPIGVSRPATGAQAQSAPPPAQSHVCGPIASNTTWTADNSPYQLDCDVTVQVDATLTVQPGVVVYATGSVLLQVEGTLIANGTASGRIVFEPCPTTCTSQGWQGMKFLDGAGSASSITYTDISGARAGLENYPGNVLDNDTFTHDGDGLRVYGTDRSLSITASLFANDTDGIVLSTPGSTSTISVTGSSVINNWTGVLDNVAPPNTHVSNDNIYGNTQWNIQMGSTAPALDAANTYWGTTDAGAIQRTVDDCHYAQDLPCVTFNPFLSTPVTDAPTQVPTSAPATTPTASPTSTLVLVGTTPPTADPTSTPLSTATTTSAGVTATATLVAGSASATPSLTSTLIPTQTPTIVSSTTATPARTPTPVPAPAPPPPPPPPGGLAPTATVTPLPTAPPPSPTAVPAASARAKTVKVEYGSANLGRAYSKPSLKHIKVRQKVKLALYVVFRNVPEGTPAYAGFRVMRSGRSVFFHRSTIHPPTSSNGAVTAYWTYFSTKQAGSYTFSGTVFLGAKHQHKTVSFVVGFA